jgi:glutamate N-acetyltransferase/amino-acid N-acetyltransferase
MADVIASSRQTSITPTEGGITAPIGFRSAGVHCGIKPNAGTLDLAVLAVDTFASMAGLFTTNLAQAAPVVVSKQHLEINQGVGCAIVVNSGCANACTGEAGLVNARRMTEEVAHALGCQPEQVLVASTGVIGVDLKMDPVVAGIRDACSSLAHGNGSEAARAIMTTDPFRRNTRCVSRPCADRSPSAAWRRVPE